MGPCMSFDELECLLEEHLDHRQQQAAEDHVEGCVSCQQTLEELAVAQNIARIRSRLTPDPVQVAPATGFLRSIKDQGPPSDLGPRDLDAISPDRLGTDCASSHETEPAAARGPLPKIAGFRIIREIEIGRASCRERVLMPV